MKKVTELCRYESAVERAAQTHLWDAELEKHVNHCTSCSEIVLAIRAFKVMALDTSESAPEPNPTKILLQSYIRESNRRSRVRKIIFKTSLAICATASSVGISLSGLYGPTLSDATKTVGDFLSVSDLTFTALPFCLLLVALSLAWIMTESELMERW